MCVLYKCTLQGNDDGLTAHHCQSPASCRANLKGMLSLARPLVTSAARPACYGRRGMHISAVLRYEADAIRALIIGSPGSGKGTLSKRLLASIPKLQYLSAGDMLRHERQLGTPLGKEADAVMRKGGLMPDQTMMNIVDARVCSLGMTASWLLDGFPRTRNQAVLFDAALRTRNQKLNLVLHLDVPNEVVMSRILERWIHEPSGRTYNLSFNPPNVPGKDDVTGEDLTKRVDDDAVSATDRSSRRFLKKNKSARRSVGNVQGSSSVVRRRYLSDGGVF